MARPSIASLLEATGEACGVAVAEIRSGSRVRTVSWARHVAVTAAVQLGWSQAGVARELGIDRKSVAYAMDKVAQDPILRAVIERVK